jgi:hypothetical protein
MKEFLISLTIMVWCTMVSVIINLASVTTYLSHFDIDLNGNENGLFNNDDYKKEKMRK